MQVNLSVQQAVLCRKCHYPPEGTAFAYNPVKFLGRKENFKTMSDLKYRRLKLC